MLYSHPDMKASGFFSLRFKLLLYSITLILVPVLLIGSLAYIESVNAVKQNILRSKLETMQLAESNMEYIFRDVEAVSLFLIQNPNLRRLLLAGDFSTMKPQLLSESTQINQYIWFLLGSKSYIDSVYIRGSNGVVIDPDETNFDISPEMDAEIRSRKGMYLWYPDRVVTKYRRTAIPVFSSIRLINDIDDITHSLGLLVINVSESAISRIFADKGVTPGSRFYLIDGAGVIRSAVDKNLLGRPLRSLYGSMDLGPSSAEGQYHELSVPGSIGKGKLVGGRFVFIRQPVGATGLTLVNITPMAELGGSGSGFRIVILAGVLLSLILSGLFAVIFSRRTLANISRLSDALREVGEGKFLVDIDIKGNDEIALLGAKIGIMSRTIADLIKENYEITLKEKEAELLALETQIAPHFLYNVLDTIYWKCRLEKAFRSAELLKALSDLFRLNLSRGDRFIPLSREIEYVRSYLLIQEEKYADRIRIEFEVDPGLSGKLVLKQVLQPILENSIIHGFASPDRRGSIRVRAFRDGTDVVLQVVDDGAGIDPLKIDEYLRREPMGRSIGLKNLNDRLRLNFGEGYRLVVERNPSGGTTVTIRQPIGEAEPC
jgi:two-component system, sensor histidine kinase YesM